MKNYSYEFYILKFTHYKSKIYVISESQISIVVGKHM